MLFTPFFFFLLFFFILYFLFFKYLFQGLDYIRMFLFETFIEDIFYKRFKKEHPDIVKPLKQILKEQEIKDKEKKKEKEKRRKEHEQEQMNNGTDEVLPF